MTTRRSGRLKRAREEPVEPSGGVEDVGDLCGVSFFGSSKSKGTTKDGQYGKYIKLVAQSAQHYQQTVKDLPDELGDSKDALAATWQSQFPTWRLQLRSGFSLLFYGYGSKRGLMTAFGDYLTDGGVVFVSAWRSGGHVTGRQIAAAAAAALFGSSQSTYKKMTAESVVGLLSRCTLKKRVYVVVNNLDAPSLRQPSEQAILASLAACSCVHFIATVDHANAAALFDKRLCDQFQWLWHHTPTFEPMLVETLGVPPILAGCKQDATQQSANVVLKTLSVSSQKVFQVLVEALLSDILEEDEEPEGITHECLFRLCRERFLVSSDVTLRSHLTEFKDHELVKTRTGTDGLALLYVPLDASKLQALLDSFEIE